MLTLITDGMRSVRAFHFDKAAASVLTTSVSRERGGSVLGPGLVVPLITPLPQMVTMEPGYLFLGSRLGNSLLLKYTEKLQEPPASSVREAADKVSAHNVGPWACPAMTPMCKTASADCLLISPASQEEPPSKKKRVEPAVGWTGERLD